MALSSRCLSILSTLYKSDDFVKVSYLANINNASERSIRYSLQKIDNFLLKHGYDCLKRHHTKGVCLNKNKEAMQFIDSFIRENTPFEYVYSKEEIRNFIILKILLGHQPISISYFEKILYISRTTVINFISLVDDYLRNKEIKLIRKPKAGIYVVCNEVVRMNEFANLLISTISMREIYNYINFGQAFSKRGKLYLNNLFDLGDLRLIQSLINDAENDLARVFDDNSYLRLMVYIARFMKRSQYGVGIGQQQIEQSKIRSTKEYKTATKLIKTLSKEYLTDDVCEEEYLYLASLLLGSKSIIMKHEDTENITHIAKEMIHYIEKTYNVEFKNQFDELLNSLALHIRPMIHRVKFNLTVENPLFGYVLENYSELFYNVKNACKILEEKLSVELDDQEISYIVLYFALALEKLNKYSSKKVKILVVCAEGLAISKVLAVSIEKMFNVKVTETLSVRSLTKDIMDQNDFVISTVDIPDVDPQKFIKVNSVISDEDFQNLKKKLEVRFDNYNSNNFSKVNKLIEAIKESCEIKDIYKLQYDLLKTINKESDNVALVKTLDFKLDFSEQFVKIKCIARDWKDAIKIGTDILLEHNCIDKRYHEKILHNIESYGAYMVIVPGVILSHAGPEDGVLKNSMSIVTLKNGVDFNDRFNVPVRLIVTLAIKEQNTHLKFLEDMMQLLENPEIVKKILEVTSNKEITKILKKNIMEGIS
ncbi:BglG family transcription antiterminator [Fonticella tunisiensis]|uniref:BglG family transcriptional antiterminator n=1 Tax=Fonticella tunisiensis TaxID=1096341 RepID=A0A4R7KM83_9CLOT|nr:BglG family transcription antiterminator [Fonticella tunisiensis]TDT56513.1 BglG family transcriptional antiterminator [Fonticella tunisiensis]